MAESVLPAMSEWTQAAELTIDSEDFNVTTKNGDILVTKNGDNLIYRREEPTTTNNIKIGESNVKLSIGEQTISKVYMGDILLYSI